MSFEQNVSISAANEYDNLYKTIIDYLKELNEHIMKVYLGGGSSLNIFSLSCNYNLCPKTYTLKILNEEIPMENKAHYLRFAKYMSNGIQIGSIFRKKMIYKLQKKVKKINSDYYLVLSINSYGDTKYNINLYWDVHQKKLKYDKSNKYVKPKKYFFAKYASNKAVHPCPTRYTAIGFTSKYYI